MVGGSVTARTKPAELLRLERPREMSSEEDLLP